MYQLMLDPKKTPADVALETGFADQLHFTQAFSKATGATPAWRQTMA